MIGVKCGISRDFAYYLKEKGVYSNYITILKRANMTEASGNIPCGGFKEQTYWKKIYYGYFDFLMEKYGSPKNVYN